MSSHLRALSVAALLVTVPAASGGTIEINLDAAHQGQGNKGLEYRPLDIHGELASVLMTARSSINASLPFDGSAAGLPGTILIDSGTLGAGVQTAGAGGSNGISGGGGHQDEEIVFTFDQPVAASSIRLGLNAFAPGRGFLSGDDSVLFIGLRGVSGMVVLDETAFLPALTWTGKESGTVAFGLLGLGASAFVDRFAVRETRDHLYVNALSYCEAAPVPVPAPLAMGLAGLAGIGIWKRRRSAR